MRISGHCRSLRARQSPRADVITSAAALDGHLSPRYMDGNCIQCNRDWDRRNGDKRKAKDREKVDRELRAKSGTPISRG